LCSRVHALLRTLLVETVFILRHVFSTLLLSYAKIEGVLAFSWTTSTTRSVSFKLLTLSGTLVIAGSGHAGLGTRGVVATWHRGEPLTLLISDPRLEALLAPDRTLSVTLSKIRILGAALITLSIVIGLFAHVWTLEAAVRVTSELFTLGRTLFILSSGETCLRAGRRFVTSIKIIILSTVIPGLISVEGISASLRTLKVTLGILKLVTIKINGGVLECLLLLGELFTNVGTGWTAPSQNTIFLPTLVQTLSSLGSSFTILACGGVAQL